MEFYFDGLLVLLHVLFAAVWMGSVTYQVLIVGRTLMAAGPAAGGFMVSFAKIGVGRYFLMAAELGKADDGQWAQLKTSDLRRLVKQVQQEQSKVLQSRAAEAKPAGPDWENPNPTPVKVHVRIETAAERLAKKGASEEPAKPDTVNIRKPGEYEIDIKGLLEKNPIVVHKDGAYLIHLPSLFDQGKK